MKGSGDLKYQRFSSDYSVFLKTVSYGFFLIVLICALLLLLGVFRISSFVFDTYDSIDKIPKNKVGLLLGTSSKEVSGQPNDYFTYRIIAASELFKAGKIDYILVSGDNRHQSYNEPREMQRALIKSGIPQDRIVFDFAGISTLDSIVRAKKVFLQNSITIISQEFHNERALFIASNFDLKAVGLNAIDPASDKLISMVKIREFFARIKCVLDIYILDTAPKFLGDPIPIGSASLPKEPSGKPKDPTSKPKYPADRQDQDDGKEYEANYGESGSEDIQTVNSEQQSLLQNEQQEALNQAASDAAQSLSSGNGVYIDPNIESPEQQQLTPSEESSSKPNAKRRRRDIKTFHGDPWDYY